MGLFFRVDVKGKVPLSDHVFDEAQKSLFRGEALFGSDLFKGLGQGGFEGDGDGAHKISFRGWKYFYRKNVRASKSSPSMEKILVKKIFVPSAKRSHPMASLTATTAPVFSS